MTKIQGKSQLFSLLIYVRLWSVHVRLRAVWVDDKFMSLVLRSCTRTLLGVVYLFIIKLLLYIFV